MKKGILIVLIVAGLGCSSSSHRGIPRQGVPDAVNSTAGEGEKPNHQSVGKRGTTPKDTAASPSVVPGRIPPPRRSWAEQKGLEKVSWDAGDNWWNLSPLLRSEPVPSGSEEVLYVYSDAGGRKGDAKSESAGIYLWYQYPPVTVETDGFSGLFESRATSIAVSYFPAGSIVPYAATLSTKRFIEVRGHSAWIVERRKANGSNVDTRTLGWEVSGAGGTTIQWLVMNHPERFSEDETIAFINMLKEVGE